MHHVRLNLRRGSTVVSLLTFLRFYQLLYWFAVLTHKKNRRAHSWLCEFSFLYVFISHTLRGRNFAAYQGKKNVLTGPIKGQGALLMKVKDLMRTNVVSLRIGDTLGVAEDIMSMGRIRHLPVVDEDDRLVGLVSQRDLFRASVSSALGFDRDKEHEWMGRIRVRDIMTKQVVTVDPEAGVSDAVEKFVADKIGCLPVTDEQGKLAGLLTETDCLRCFRDLLKLGKLKEVLS